MNTFEELQLPAELLKSVRALNYQAPTPIQAKTIPIIQQSQDLMATAETGSGKTAAFCLPLIQKFLSLRQTDPAGLILVPTRELAQQIDRNWRDLTQFSPQMYCATLIGGASVKQQLRWISKRPMVIIATPGRLNDHLRMGSVKLHQIKCLVLDEADRMLDMGFAPQLRQIQRYLPKTRQTLLFSATTSNDVQRLSQQYLKNPVQISVGPANRAVSRIEQSTLSMSSQKKNEVLLNEINRNNGQILVFARTKSRTDRLARYLNSYGLDVNRLHGGRTQGQRKSALQGFRDGSTRILIATDIAARGIDVSNIAQVINYDLPMVPEDYIHRIGRTARAGTEGKALSFLTPEDRQQWASIIKMLKKSGSELPKAAGQR